MSEGRDSEEVLRGFSRASRSSLSQEILERSREAIVRGHLRPGERLSESRMAEAFGVSRGPVREALGQLQKEGLVRMEPHKGARVARLSREDVEELYELRIDLEQLAVKRAVRLAGEEELGEMEEVVRAYEEAVNREEVEEAVDLDMKFHDLIYQGAHHNRLYICWSTLLRSQIHAFVFSRSVVDPAYMVPCVSEHAELYESIREDERGRATEIVLRHLSTAYERLVKIPFEWSE